MPETKTPNVIDLWIIIREEYEKAGKTPTAVGETACWMYRMEFLARQHAEKIAAGEETIDDFIEAVRFEAKHEGEIEL